MMKYLLCGIICCFLASFSVAQDFQAEFSKHFAEEDSAQQIETLRNWEKAEPKDPELFTAYFNYYYRKARQEYLSFTPEAPNGESLAILDSSGKTNMFLGSQIRFDEIILNKGFDKINQGIELYPNRLDMRFGKIYVLGVLEDWEAFSNEILKAIEHSDKIKNEWTWTKGEIKEDGEAFFLAGLQDYQLTLYNSDNEQALIKMRNIANAVLKYYPQHIESLSNLAVTYYITQQYELGIESLLKAERINPKDAIVLSNIAHGYKLLDQKKKSIEYYKKTIEYGDQKLALYAREQIKELSK